MAGNPNTPVTASSPVPPPFQNLPFGQVRGDGQVYLSTVAIQFLQELWAAIQGQGGVIDLVLTSSTSPGFVEAITQALIAAQAPQAALVVAGLDRTAEVVEAAQALALTVLPPPAIPAPAVVRANSHAFPGNPTPPASTVSFTMQGLAGTLTPLSSGTVLLIISGTVIGVAGVAADTGIQYRIAYGTGAAPANGAAAVGTVVGPAQKYTNPTIATVAGDVNVPFSIQALITGLVAGTAYWLDLQASSILTASDMQLSLISISALEL